MGISNYRRLKFFYLFFCVFFFNLKSYAIEYTVSFQNVQDRKILEALQASSQLTALKNIPPPSLGALEMRAKADLTHLLQGMQSLAYYDAKIDYQIESRGDCATVFIQVDPGPVYPLSSFEVLPHIEGGSSPLMQFPFETLCLEEIGVRIGEPALPQEILNAEEMLINILNWEGYPFAKIEKREVLADQSAKTLSVKLYVDSGPLAYFGPVTIKGNFSVCNLFFYKKLMWRFGQAYNPCKIEKTITSIENSGLFRSVAITHGEQLDERGTLPIEIEVREAKQRSIGLGFNYTTQLGPGITAEWEHRNIRNLGEKLTFTTDIWKDLQQVKLLYLMPDFCCPNQNLIWLGEFEHEKTKGFIETSFSVSTILERQINDYLYFSYGGMYKYLLSQDSDKNGSFNLLKAPIQLKWNYTNDLLDPTRGFMTSFRITPTVQILSPRFFYSINLVTGSYYLPINSTNTLALKGMFGSILGSKRRAIPSPERFYAGSENTLRGYNYLTVSPLDKDHDPIGGRSLIIGSAEWRARFGECFGGVLFYDVGNVYSDPLPQFDRGLLQSVGLGARYYTQIGPLRLDAAFPLNRRKHVDAPYQIYFSIGQAF